MPYTDTSTPTARAARSAINRRYRETHAARLVERNRAHVKAYLDAHPCVDCGNSDLRVLEFDHVRPGKAFQLSKALTGHYSLATVDREIAKCEVRCANCHRIKTYTERGLSHRG